jgi:hypothetical protein
MGRTRNQKPRRSTESTRLKVGAEPGVGGRGWRRLVFLGWTAVGALVAFLAALAALPSFYRELFGPDTSAEFTFEGQSLDGLNVRVTNTGKKAFSINMGTITVATKEGKAIGELATEKKYFHTKSMLIEPDQAQIITYYLVGYKGWVFPAPDGVCELRLDYFGHDNSEHESYQKVDCGDIQDFGMITWGGWTMANGRKASDNLGVGEPTEK